MYAHYIAHEVMSSLVIQNPWWRTSQSIESDKYIIQFEESGVKWNPRIRYFFDMSHDHVYTLRGPRQVGKTTLVKLIIRDLIRGGVSPRRIFYWTCDLVEGPKALVEMLDNYFMFSREFQSERRYIFLDEISAVKDWQRGIKFLYDTGKLENSTVIMTGSHSLDIRKAAERLPGRRGTMKDPVDKVLLPMKFAEYIETRDEDMANLFSSLDLLRFKNRRRIIEEVGKGEIPKVIEELALSRNELSKYLDDYLLTGGIPRALNDYEKFGEIKQETYSTYVQVTIGDILRWDKRETYLVQLIRRVIDTLSSQVSWRSLKKDTDIGHTNTVSEYIDVLKSSFVLCPIYVLDRSKRRPMYGRNKKIHFHDPFIFHALRGWINQASSYQEALNYLSGDGKSKLIEGIVCDHLIRFAFGLNPIDNFEPTLNLMYWKSKRNEVDFVLKFGEGYIPFEVKYSSSLSRREINGIYSFTRSQSEYKGIVITKDLLNNDKGVVALPAYILLALI